MADKPDVRKQPVDKPSRRSIELQEQLPDRNEELSDRKNIREAALKLYSQIEKGYADQWDRANNQMDYWDIYNCELGPKQFYAGNSKVYVPIVKDAVDARKTRFVNQIFPMTGKNVEVITSEDKPQALMSLLEYYIRKTRLRSVVVPALMKNGDVEGQYNIYMNWTEVERHVAWRTLQTDEELDEDPELTVEDTEEFYDLKEETIKQGYPTCEVVPDADVLILPTTASTAEEAIQIGGSVTVLRRSSEAQVEQMIEDEEIDGEFGRTLLDNLKTKTITQTPDKKKKITDAAGIKSEEGKFFALWYETWTLLTLKDEEGEKERRMCRIRFGGEDLILSIKRNPFWCDHCPLITAPADRTEGSGKGRSRVKTVETLQYAANDAVNEGFDSATYALLPIVMTDPLKNPRTGSMVLNIAAVWETNPKDTSFAQFPSLWKDAFELVNSCKNQIFQSLGVNPAMMPMGQQSQGKGGKTNQAAVAQEQQVDLLMTADSVIGISDDVLTPILRWFIWLDHQFRDEDLTLRQFGVLGHEMNMEKIAPVQMERRFEVRWFGVEAMRSIQQMQQQMAGLNVVRGIPPQQYEGFRLNLAPVLQQFMENLFGPRLAQQVFKSLKDELSLDPNFENELLQQGFQVPVNQFDDDQEHLKAHMELFQQAGDQQGNVRLHLMLHAMNMQKKGAQQQMQQHPQGAQGVPGGAGPGVPGQPRQGAKTGGPRGGQQPAGAIHNDQIRGTNVMPRSRGAA